MSSVMEPMLFYKRDNIWLMALSRIGKCFAEEADTGVLSLKVIDCP